MRYEGQVRGSIREDPEKLTLRTEEVRSEKSCINVDHIAQDRWRTPLADADWHAFCQAIYKGIEGRDWEELYDYYKEMVQKPNQSHKAKAQRQDFWEKMKRDWNCGKSTSKTRLWHWIMR